MNPETQPKRVVGYIRGSTEEQQNTLTAQRAQIEAYCAYKNLELVPASETDTCFTDEGESAFSVGFYERPKAAEMLSRLTELNAGAIIITKLDRGFRDALDCLFTLDQLEKQGIGLHLLDIQLDPDSPVGKLLITMMAAIAEFENKRRSERQKAAFTVMRAQGKRCGTVPYGWTVVAGVSPAVLAPHPAEQRILHKIVRWIEREETGVSKVARLLNLDGTRTKGGGKWYPASVASVYKHRRLDPKFAESSTPTPGSTGCQPVGSGSLPEQSPSSSSQAAKTSGLTARAPQPPTEKAA